MPSYMGSLFLSKSKVMNPIDVEPALVVNSYEAFIDVVFPVLILKSMSLRGRTVVFDPLRTAQFDAIVLVPGVATMGVAMPLRSPCRLDNIGKSWAWWFDVDG